MYDRWLMWSRTTSAIERALWRIEAVSAVMSCTPPMKIEPTRIQISAGSQPNIDAGQNGPHDRPRRCDRRKVLAQQKLRLDRLVVEVVAQLDGRRRPPRIELEEIGSETGRT